jgi:hypothetical protein
MSLPVQGGRVMGTPENIEYLASDYFRIKSDLGFRVTGIPLQTCS